MFLRPLVLAFDGKALVEIGQFLEALAQNVVGKLRGLEDFLVRLEVHLGTVSVGMVVHYCEFIHGHAALVVLTIGLAVATYGHLKPFGQGIDAGNAHAVQATGHLVAVVVELAASVQFGHDHLYRRDMFLGMLVHGDTAAVVAHSDAVVCMEGDLYLVAETGHGLVYAVVDNFIDKVMQTPGVHRTNVHGRSFADSRKALENGNGGRVVIRFHFCFCH